jgi:hypothetical protein
MRTRHATVLALSLLALGGCDRIKETLARKAAEKVVEKATGTDVDLGSSSGTVTVRDPKSGAVIQAGASLPDGWPSSAAPLYPGAKIVGSVSTPEGKHVTFTTKDSPAQVDAFYKAKLPGKQEAALDMGDSKMLTKKDGKTSYIATIGKGGDETTVQLAVATK